LPRGGAAELVVAALAHDRADDAVGDADGTDMLSRPAVVIGDAAGTIRWIDVRPNYVLRTEPAEILVALASLEL
jgi:hypothetical protein